MFFLCKADIHGQDIIPSVTNILRYGNGDRELGAFGEKQKYFENLMDIRASILENFSAGFRFLYDKPPEIGKSFTGIKRRFIEYEDDRIYFRAGNSSTLFGKGLALNLFENRGLAYDTWMDGIKASYSAPWIKGTFIGGIIDFRDSVTIERNEEYELYGGNIEIFPVAQITAGISYISASGKLKQGDNAILSKNIKAEIPELYLYFSLDKITFNINWSHKKTDVKSDKIKAEGTGLYSSFSYAGERFGLTLDYKNYLFDKSTPYERFDNSRATRMLPFQNPPIVQREHSFTLLSRALHEVDFNDEVGIQIEAFYSINDNTTLTFNASLSSLHNKFELNSDGFTFNEIKRKGNFFPSVGKEYFPYYEVFIEGEYYYALTSAVRGGFSIREKTFFNEFSNDKSSTVTKSIIIPLQIQHVFNRNMSGTLQSEHEWINESSKVGNINHFNHLITAVGTIWSKLTLGLRYEYTTTDDDLSGRKNWLIGEVGYRLWQSNVITLSYGRERGGQICSNGVCRYIQPFNGFRLSILTQI